MYRVLIALILAVAAAAIAVARGGSLESLAQTRWLWLPSLIVALVIQVGYSVLPIELSEERARVVILLTYVLVVKFALFNKRLPGMIVVAIGVSLNIAVIAANGAMPVSVSAAEAAGVGTSFENAGIKHEPMDDDTTFPWLGDVIPVPGLKEVVSVGDVLLALGITHLVYSRTLAGREEPSKAASEASD